MISDSRGNQEKVMAIHRDLFKTDLGGVQYCSEKKMVIDLKRFNGDFIGA